MRCGGRGCIGLVVAMAGLAATSACSQTPRDPAPTPMDFSSRQIRAPGEYLVTLAAGADVKAIADLYGRFGIKGTQGLGRNIFLVTLTEDPGPAKMEKLRGQNAQIEAVQPNFVYRGNGRGNIQ
ncbi:MAG: hypothetical protein HY067_16400 [Betaproteobacteria bacterium]|nr:hypothetical protein [Betaproteobacteria bacterium]